MARVPRPHPRQSLTPLLRNPTLPLQQKIPPRALKRSKKAATWLSKPRNTAKHSISIQKPSVSIIINQSSTYSSSLSYCDVHPTGLNPNEPSYLTNRAAAYMQLKRFRPALEDCQHAVTLQSASPSSKTLIRLARCQVALGSTTAATSTINNVLSIEPKNSQALQLQGKIEALEGHVKNFETAKSRKDWGLARLALDKCLQAIEGEGGEIPAEWRIWRVELELARGNWDAANIAAKFV